MLRPWPALYRENLQDETKLIASHQKLAEILEARVSFTQ
jgi:hypothetical protein